MRRTWLALGLALCAGLTACGGARDPLRAVDAALAGRHISQAEALLRGVVQAHPGLRTAHMRLFVVAQYLAAQGDASRQKAFQDEVLREYDWLAKSYGISPDYGDMQSSLKAQPQAAADLAAARKPVYGD